jgi:assimilatory nitrate reductase catalytic subunit
LLPQRSILAEPFGWDGPAAIFREHAALSGFENDGGRIFDIGVLAELDDAAYDQMGPMQWPAPACEGKESSALPPTRLFSSGGFPTPDGRANCIPTPYRSLTSTPRPFLLNTGRVRDQWHTMTRTGRVPRLMTHASEPTVALNPADAARLDLAPGDLARIETDAGAAILRVAVTAAQRPGELFVPMHWTDAFASAGPVGRVVTAAVDPHSGQPELKATPASLTPVRARYHGMLLRREGGALPDACHWVRIPLPNGQLYRLAGTRDLPTGAALDLFCAALLGPLPAATEWVEMEDVARGVLRRAALVDGVLHVCLLLARAAEALPQPEAIAPLLGTTIPEGERWRALAGGRIAAAANAGPPLCTCFGVGRDTVRQAVMQHGLRTTKDIGKHLDAGTNCGSCLPELAALLREVHAQHELGEVRTQQGLRDVHAQQGSGARVAAGPPAFADSAND